MDLKKLDIALKNEPSFRLKQVKRSLFVDLIDDWQQATTLSKELRERLNKNISIFIKGKTLISNDKKTMKSLIALEDGEKIEVVLMKHKNGRNTVCLSSQVGCSLACEFCATGKLGLKRSLTSSEIITQFLFFARLLKKSEERITNVVFMGMGEPFLNYDNVLEAIRIINNKDCFNVGARKISISTVGIIKGIERLSREKLQINLALSLHTVDNNLRSKLMPINKKYSIDLIFDAIKKYVNKTRRKVMFEYVMIDGVNDGEKNAKALAEVMKNEFYFVNLISYNSTGIFKASSSVKIKDFKKILEEEHINVTQRYKFGDNIEAACGQLAGQDVV